MNMKNQGDINSLEAYIRFTIYKKQKIALYERMLKEKYEMMARLKKLITKYFL